MAHTETRSMLDDYTSAVLVQGQPPGGQFHEKLLRLEKGAFLAGKHKAFVFGAGPVRSVRNVPRMADADFTIWPGLPWKVRVSTSMPPLTGQGGL